MSRSKIASVDSTLCENKKSLLRAIARFTQRSVPIITMVVPFFGFTLMPSTTYGAQLRRRLAATPSADSRTAARPSAEHASQTGVSGVRDDLSCDSDQDPDRAQKKSREASKPTTYKEAIEQCLNDELVQITKIRSVFDEWKKDKLSQPTDHKDLQWKLKEIYKALKRVHGERTQFWKHQKEVVSRGIIRFNSAQIESFGQMAKDFQQRVQTHFKFALEICDDYFNDLQRVEDKIRHRQERHIDTRELLFLENEQRILEKERQILKDAIAREDADIARKRRQLEEDRQAHEADVLAQEEAAVAREKLEIELEEAQLALAKLKLQEAERALRRRQGLPSFESAKK